MIKRSCNHCDDEVYLAESGESLEGYETPLDHLGRTGHAYNEPVLRKCLDCGNVWGYSGDSDRPTCSNPNCRGKRTELVD